jgi:hypothetical protein
MRCLLFHSNRALFVAKFFLLILVVLRLSCSSVTTLRGCICLFLLMGLNWVFGAMVVAFEDDVLWHYLFSITTVMQGMAVVYRSLFQVREQS